jgi:hypothetical protein
MAPLSKSSIQALVGVHPTLVQMITEFTEWYDVHVSNGIRTDEQEAEYVKEALSETTHSKHLVQPDGFGHAIDFEPTPIEWDNSTPATINGRPITKYEVECIGMLFAFKAYCFAKGVKVRIGADWNMNNSWRDNKFNDLDHAEILLDG